MTEAGKDGERCGFAAIIGAPNAGKSTLVNALVGAKVTIVTHKVQTTRFNVRGVFVQGKSQIVLVDTPGIFTPRRALDRAMVQAAWSGASEADTILHLADAPACMHAGNAIAEVETIAEGLKSHNLRADLALNKIDLVPKEKLLELAEHFGKSGIYSRIFMISARKGSGLDEVRTSLARIMPPGPWHYPADQIGDLPARLLAAEITREKLMLRVHEELPYAASIETESWQDQGKRGIRVGQIIYVQRQSQRKIVLGKGGQTIKAIGTAARQELSRIFERKVHLFLHVKVRENWATDRAHLALFGLDIG